MLYFVRLEAKPGKEQAVADFLAAGVEMTNQEVDLVRPEAIAEHVRCLRRFSCEEDRQAHLAGHMAKSLMSRVNEMLARPPAVESFDVLAMKNTLA